eukprot:TRINITY_DN6220_c0_g1_i1.p1 TRINITY_DN6220_c0_g1~~TRINITY_DN6220_c0_g1_i1.p1  ORF type:complete len:245 (+),score=29.56 TRINITY_DN6220_c0_g1_i1:585-1319(+)
MDSIRLYQKLHLSSEIVEDWTVVMKLWVTKNLILITLQKCDTAEQIIRENNLGTLENIYNCQNEEFYYFWQKLKGHISIHGAPVSYIKQRLISMVDAGEQTSDTSRIVGWKEEYPTDAMIIMHLFCSFMDENLSLSRTGDQYPMEQSFPFKHPFTSNHFAAEKKPIAHLDSPVIIQEVKKSQYGLVVRTSNTTPHETLPITEGRKNIYHTLVLYVFCVKKYNNGFVGNHDLNTRQFGFRGLFEA